MSIDVVLSSIDDLRAARQCGGSHDLYVHSFIEDIPPVIMTIRSIIDRCITYQCQGLNSGKSESSRRPPLDHPHSVASKQIAFSSHLRSLDSTTPPCRHWLLGMKLDIRVAITRLPLPLSEQTFTPAY